MPTIEMSLSSWSDVPDNPRQRNTVKRAKNAVRKHLSRYCKLHRIVFAAVLDGNVLCKLDGHTRGYLWDEGLLDGPPDGKVEVVMIDVASMDEAKDIHLQLDSRAAAKRPNDLIYGATREHGFELSSGLLRSCSFAQQLGTAESGTRSHGVDLFDLVGKWKKHLMALDSLGLTSNYTILIALMLVAVKRDGIATAGPFCTALDANQGTKNSKGMDGVQALYSHLEIRRAQQRTSGWDNLNDILIRGWNAYLMWTEGKRARSIPTKDRISDVITGQSKPRRRTAKIGNNRNRKDA